MEESSQQSELKKLQCFTKNCRQWAEGGGRVESRERAGGQAPVGFRLGGENLRLRCENKAFGILVGQCFNVIHMRNMTGEQTQKLQSSSSLHDLQHFPCIESEKEQLSMCRAGRHLVLDVAQAIGIILGANGPCKE
jgi:hypothetical protein